MPEYIVCPIDGARHAGPTRIIACDTDDEAIEQAKTPLDGDALEVSDEGRLVAAIQRPRLRG
jgi:threonine dehydrogenase-like Zn-dependent dehydrogenase